ncbi:MAG: AI-2E family transporter [Desulfatibacillum sp.]|nr:AI-2E family transporter [Desulfatibacillum sp.]
MSRSANLSDYGGGFLLFCLLCALAFAYVVMRPFLTIFLVSMVLAIIAHPLHTWSLKITKNRDSLAALVTVVMVLLLIVLPAIIMVVLLANESAQVVVWINKGVDSGLFTDKTVHKLTALQQKYLPDVEINPIEIGKSLSGAAAWLSKKLISYSATAVGALGSTLWKFILMLFTLFYFLRDGRDALRWAMHLSPLKQSLETEIIDCFQEVSRSAFYGTFLTALAQGLLGGIGLFFAGLPPLTWGLFMAFFSMIPVVGTALVWVPATILLYATGKIGSAIFLAIWCIVVVGASDNVLRPLLMRGKNPLHPLLIFFSLLGGLSAFGLLGILLGPLAIVLLIALLKAYEEAASPILNGLDGH